MRDLARAALLRPDVYSAAGESQISGWAAAGFVVAVYGLVAISAVVLGDSTHGFTSILAFAAWGLARWALVTWVLWFVAVHGFDGVGDVRALGRATALAHVVLLVQVLPLDPVIVNVVAAAWLVAALGMAAHGVLRISVWRGLATGVMGAAGLLIVSNVFLIPISIVGIY